MTALPMLDDVCGGPEQTEAPAQGRSAGGPKAPPRVKLSRYDWVLLNSSGGKDSQTLIRVMVQMARDQGYPLDRLVVVHCDLGPRVEWDGTRELAEEQAKHYGLRFEVVSRPQGDILEEVRQRWGTIQAKAALMLAGKHNRAKLDEYVKVEEEVGSRFRVELSLREVRDALGRGEEPGPVSSWEMP